MTKGVPGRVTPAAWKAASGAGFAASRSASYQRLGAARERCMSFESVGFPEAVREPETAHALEPATQELHGEWKRASVCSSAIRSATDVVLVPGSVTGRRSFDCDSSSGMSWNSG